MNVPQFSVGERPLVAQTISPDEMFRAVLASSRTGDGRQEIDENVWEDLDWPHFCHALSAHCATEDARALAEALGVLPAAFARARVREVQEAMSLQEQGARPPIGEMPSLRHAILRCKKVDALDAEDLLGLAALLVSARRVRRFYASHSERAPRLVQHADRLADEASLANDIRRTFDDGGIMRDEASPELAQKRKRYRRVRDAILARMDKYLRDPRFEGILQDEYVTLRQDRYVLPVRSGERGDVRGIVHGQSGSGGTLFIEPQELVPLNNELAVVQADIALEEQRIRRALTTALRDIIDDVELSADMLAFLDFTHAQATLCGEMRAHVVQLREDDATGFDLRQARHPLLALRAHHQQFEVISNHIAIEDAAQALVISGPNTGGKTVVLKTLGMYALMVRAGFALPASADATARIYQRVFTDIGDEQSIQSNLSTFSAHVENIASFVSKVKAGDLVLLDELFAGTDPGQAATLGRALIDDLIGRGAFVVVTTHLEGLKSIAFEDDRYAAASMTFDIERMMPTYRLRPGVPGASWAHRIAQRLGMPEAIIERAQKMQAPSSGVVDEEHLARMEKALRQAEDAREHAEQLRNDAQNDRKEAAELLEKARVRQRKDLDAEVKRARDEARLTRQEIREIRQKMRALREQERPTDQEAERIIQEAREVVRKVEERTQAQTIAKQGLHEAPRAEDLRVDERVWVVPYQHEGVIDEPISDPKSVAVRMGPVRVRVPLEQLRKIDKNAVKKDEKPSPVHQTRFHDDDLSYRVDLRGERVEDAEEIVDAYMERAERASMPFVLFIHGHGTGALRRAVRTRLHDLPYDLEIRPGHQNEGGEGVTIAEFISKHA